MRVRHEDVCTRPFTYHSFGRLSERNISLTVRKVVVEVLPSGNRTLDSLVEDEPKVL